MPRSCTLASARVRVELVAFTMSDAYRFKTTNAVLIKDDVGRAKKSCYDLPHESHAYGRAEPADMEGAREVTMHWAAHVPRPKPDADQQDFKMINKMASKAKVVNARQLKEFKAQTDIKVMPPAAAGPPPKVIPSDVIPSFAYGRKSRPSTPIASVIGSQYSLEYEEILSMAYDGYEQQKAASDGKTKIRLTRAAKSIINGARQNRANLLRAETEPPKAKFCMKKFTNIPSRLNIGAPTSSMSKCASAPQLGHAQSEEY